MKKILFAAPRIKRYETDDFTPSGRPVFVAVALRGEQCSLQCDHCRGRMLSALYRADGPEGFARLADSLAAQGCRGLLLTGGCDRDGTIPLHEFARAAREAKERHGFRLATHTKFVTERFADAALEAGVDLLMLDIVGDLETLREVYHLRQAGLEDVERSLDRAGARGLALAPHILIGLARGQIRGEWRALEMLEGRENLETLVLVVLTPLLNTPMAGPRVDEDGVIVVMAEARRRFPRTRLALGCAKTGGASQRRFEQAALDLGFDAIAYPSEGMVDRARSLGFQVEFSESCCAFWNINT